MATAARAGDGPPRLDHMAATGALSLSGTPDGAILPASGFRPGDSVSGTVTLTNTGAADGRLALDRTGLLDLPGRGAGRLSAALILRVEELGANGARELFAGPLAGLEHLELGTIAAGAPRTYAMIPLLPEGGPPPGPLAGDNALQGASVRVDWTWSTEPISPPAPPEPTPLPPVPAPLPPPGGQPPIVVGGAPPALTLRIPRQRVLRTRGITALGTCDEPCSVRFRARVQTAPRGHKARRTLQRRKVLRGRLTRALTPGVEQRTPCD